MGESGCGYIHVGEAGSIIRQNMVVPWIASPSPTVSSRVRCFSTTSPDSSHPLMETRTLDCGVGRVDKP